ncbi:HAMP domain-containing sensor histidine kinase [Deinococcus sp. 43]|nr:HAMP domain-containing sensor histidine kinase [Deinococcus sp. GbtcB9]MDK2013215.1 HAMP domain-containing sensor histidine kinase [Deinococcus sp. 43]
MTTPPTPNPATPTTPERSERRLLAASAGLITAIVLTDILTPASLVIGTLVSAPLALAALGATRRATVNLTALAVTGNVLAGLVNATRDGATPTDLGNRAVSILAALLVGFLSLRAREAATRAARLHEEERRLQRERALRALIEAVSGPLTQAQFVTRAAHALQALTGAAAVEIGSVDRAVLREPHAYTGPGEGSLGRRLPLDLLARPATRDPGQGRPDQVWAVGGGDTFVARLTRPSDPELLILLTRPAVPPDQLSEAVQTLQPLLDRTALLDDLHARQAQLQERGELLQDLIYSFSHDLRTPLMANAVNMRSALKGAYGPLPDDYAATLRNGLDANAALLTLADQLLLVAKYESGEEDSELQSVPLRDLVLNVTEQLRPAAAARGVTIEPTLDGARVPGRKHDLRRAVQNLLDNAVRYAPPGSAVHVTLDRADGEAILSVLDSGPGVSAPRAPTLFQRFRSGGAGGGTGLGLYLTRRIAERHGGTVTYARTARAQSVFTLTLPLEDA